MNTRHYLPGELRGIEPARRRGYVATSQYDDDLAIDWYSICREEGLPFVQCAVRGKYHVIDYDLEPFISARLGIAGLAPAALERIRTEAQAACKASPNRQARALVGDTSGVISGIPRDDAHRLARYLVSVFRTMGAYCEVSK